MASVVVACPRTGVPIRTGLTVRYLAEHRMTSIAFGPCPACGDHHASSLQDAWIEGARPPARVGIAPPLRSSTSPNLTALDALLAEIEDYCHDLEHSEPRAPLRAYTRT